MAEICVFDGAVWATMFDMAQIGSWTVQDALWKEIEPLIPARQRPRDKPFQRRHQAGFFLRIWQAGLAEYDDMQGIAWQWQSDVAPENRTRV